LADELDRQGMVFPKQPPDGSLSVAPEHFMPGLLHELLPLLLLRSGLGPVVEQRAPLMLGGTCTCEKSASASLHTELMRKIGAAYSSYRDSLMDLVAHSQDLLGSSPYANGDVTKLAEADVHDVFTPLSEAYLRTAFLDEVGMPPTPGVTEQAVAGVERGLPS